MDKARDPGLTFSTLEEALVRRVNVDIDVCNELLFKLAMKAFVFRLTICFWHWMEEEE